MNPAGDSHTPEPLSHAVRYGEDDAPAAEASLQALIQARRELARWKVIAAEHESRLRAMESSASWRYLAPVRLAEEILPRWKAFLLLGIIGLLTLPLWPLILLVALLKPGRDFLWSSLTRLGSAGKLLQDIYARLKSHGAEATLQGDQRAVYVFQRPFEDEPGAALHSTTSAPGDLIGQLSPQQRAVMGTLANEPWACMDAPDNAVLSLARAERNFMLLYAAHKSAHRSDP